MTVLPTSSFSRLVPAMVSRPHDGIDEVAKPFAGHLEEALANGSQQVTGPMALPPDEHHTDYRITRATDNKAVRFNERPLVGPADVQDAADPATSRAAPPLQSERIGETGGRLSPPQVIEAAFSRDEAHPTEPGRPLGQVDCSNGGNRPQRTSNCVTDLPFFSKTSSLDWLPPSRLAVIAARGVSRAVQLPAATIAIARHEVVVTVRGLKLSAAEREGLAESVRALLAAAQLELRPIRIVSRSSEV